MKFDLSQFDDVSIYKSEKDIPRPDSSDLHAMSLYDYARARFRLAQNEAHYQATKVAVLFVIDVHCAVCKDTHIGRIV